MSRKTTRKRRERARKAEIAKSAPATEQVEKQVEPVLERRITPEQLQGMAGFRGDSPLRSFNGIYFSNTARESVSISEMVKNVPIINRAIKDFQNSCSLSNWDAIPAIEEFTQGEGGARTLTPESEEAKRMADLVKEHILENPNFNFNDVVRRDSGYKYWGFAVSEFEMYLDRRNGIWSFLNIAPRAQATIGRFVEDRRTNTITGFYQSYDRPIIQRYKTVYVVDDSLDDRPEGLGDLAPLKGHAKRWLNYIDLEDLALWQDLRGTPIARLPIAEYLNGTMNDGERKAFEQIFRNTEILLDNQNRNANLSVVYDSTPFKTSDEADRPSTVRKYELETHQGESKGLTELFNVIVRLEHEMARGLAAEHILLGDTDSGSRALSEDKSKAFYQKVEEALDSLRKAYQNDLVTTFFLANGFDLDLMPKLQVERVDFTTLEEDIDSMVKVFNGVPYDSPAVDYFAAKRGVPIQSLQERIDKQAERERREMEMNRRNGDEPSSDRSQRD